MSLAAIYGITQCYLPPDTNEHTPATQASTQFTYRVRMEHMGQWGHVPPILGLRGTL